MPFWIKVRGTPQVGDHLVSNDHKKYGTVLLVSPNGKRVVSGLFDSDSVPNSEVDNTPAWIVRQYIWMKMETSASTDASHAFALFNPVKEAKTKVFLPKREENKEPEYIKKNMDMFTRDHEAITHAGNLTPEETQTALSSFNFYNQYVRVANERFVPFPIVSKVIQGNNNTSDNVSDINWNSVPQTNVPPGTGDTILTRRTVILKAAEFAKGNGNGSLTSDQMAEINRLRTAFGRRHKRKIINFKSFAKRYHNPSRALAKYLKALSL